MALLQQNVFIWIPKWQNHLSFTKPATCRLHLGRSIKISIPLNIKCHIDRLLLWANLCVSCRLMLHRHFLSKLHHIHPFPFIHPSKSTDCTCSRVAEKFLHGARPVQGKVSTQEHHKIDDDFDEFFECLFVCKYLQLGLPFKIESCCFDSWECSLTVKLLKIGFPYWLSYRIHVFSFHISVQVTLDIWVVVKNYAKILFRKEQNLCSAQVENCIWNQCLYNRRSNFIWKKLDLKMLEGCLLNLYILYPHKLQLIFGLIPSCLWECLTRLNFVWEKRSNAEKTFAVLGGAVSVQSLSFSFEGR